jgi:hypothetical protein
VASAPDASEPTKPWRVLAWITLVASSALATLCCLLAIYLFLAASSGSTDDGLVYFFVVLVVAPTAICLTASAMVALISIIKGRRSWMVAATVLGVLVIVPVVGGGILVLARFAA